MPNFYDEISKMLGDDNPKKTPTIQENLDCLKLAVKGSDEAVNKYIISNIKLVSAAVTKFLLKHPEAQYLADDMFDVGLLTMTKGIKRYVEQMRLDKKKWLTLLDDPNDNSYNIPGYLYISIYKNVQECYELESSDPISNRARTRHTPDKCSSPTRKLDIRDEFLEKQMCDPFKMIYLLEDIQGTCKTPIDKAIVEGCLNLTPVKEVAASLGISISKYYQKRNDLHRRFCIDAGINP